MSVPVIAFGQQPCGFFPKRFLVSKIWTARKLQERIGGEIVFFYHDCDHDPRETQTLLRHRNTGELHRLNFAFENKAQKKYTPLYAKKVERNWKENTGRQLPNFVAPSLVDLFLSVDADTVGAFCLEMYRGMGLLKGVRVERSGDPSFREKAVDVEDYFLDTEFEGELVRARRSGEGFVLHKGGDAYQEVPVPCVEKRMVSPARDSRLRWMQSVIRCTHYIAGEGEIKYLNREDAPEIEYVQRDPIERHDEAYIGDE